MLTVSLNASGATVITPGASDHVIYVSSSTGNDNNNGLTPQTAVATPYGQSYRVVWRDAAPDLFGSRTGSHAQARAPPSIS